MSLWGAQKIGRRWRSMGLAAALLAFSPLPALPAQLITIDPHARYPEGPLWRGKALLYVEYAASNIKRWDGKHAAVWWHKDHCGANALIPFQGHLLVACYDANALVELDADGHEVRTLRVDSKGKGFVGPNDFASDGRGGIYFSASGVYDVRAPITGAVLHIGPDRSITEVADTIDYSNGLTLAADRKHLLVAEMLAARILSFPIDADGNLGLRTVWARLQDLAPATPREDAYNGPDGVKLGPDGNYYIAQNGSGRVLVVSEKRKLVRIISVPTPYVTNIAFGPGGSVFITGAFDQWKPPFPGAVYLWKP